MFVKKKNQFSTFTKKEKGFKYRNFLYIKIDNKNYKFITPSQNSFLKKFIIVETASP